MCHKSTSIITGNSSSGALKLELLTLVLQLFIFPPSFTPTMHYLSITQETTSRRLLLQPSSFILYTYFIRWSLVSKNYWWISGKHMATSRAHTIIRGWVTVGRGWGGFIHFLQDKNHYNWHKYIFNLVSETPCQYTW